jgi:hypothetical protein
METSFKQLREAHTLRKYFLGLKVLLDLIS